MTVTVRILGQEDAGALEAFLVQHRDTSMILRSNSRKYGLVDRGAPFQATYAAAFDGDRIVAVAAHSTNGMVIVQAPVQADAVANASVQKSGRKVTGFLGPLDHVRAVRRARGFDAVEAAFDGEELMFGLDLENLRLPPGLTSGELTVRNPLQEEYALLGEWRIGYDMELFGAKDTPEQRERAWTFLKNQIDRGEAWVAIAGGVPVSLSGFNASLPDIVQLGGIYTPPELRGNGYAKASVGGSLLAAREAGAARAVLFTSSDKAVRTYEYLGFGRLPGAYSLVFLR